METVRGGTNGTIRDALARLDAALERKRGFGACTNRSVTTCPEDLRCSTEEGDWGVTTDLPTALGGGATAPTPGALVRAALGSCMAMSYRLRAARHGIAMTAITVTVETDSELVGMLSGACEVPPGFTAVRYHVEVESPAPTHVVEQLLDEADRLSPILDVFVRANDVERTVEIRQAAA
jgi:uncharacterized OsmC-like protein